MKRAGFLGYYLTAGLFNSKIQTNICSQLCRRSLTETTNSENFNERSGTEITDKRDSNEPEVDLYGKRVMFRRRKYVTKTHEDCMKYMESEAYQNVYGTNDVWTTYRRNYRGRINPRRTRRTCVIGGVYVIGNPCPICRDEYLVLDYKNPRLLRQFVDRFSGEVLEARACGLCRRQYGRLLLEVAKAHDVGYLEVPLQLRLYDHWHGEEEEEGYSDQEEDDEVEAALAGLPRQLPHARPYVVEPPARVVERPRVPNRYEMEEGVKVRKLLADRLARQKKKR